MVPDVAIGSMVRVPLAGRRVGGWVVALREASTLEAGARPGGGDVVDAAGTDPDATVPLARLVPLARWSGHGPPADLVDLARWAAQRFGAGRLRPFLVTASPPTMVRAVRPRAEPSPGELAGASHAARRLLADGGGVIRTTPSDDPFPIVLAAAELGPVLVVQPSLAAHGPLAQRLAELGVGAAVLPEAWAAAAGGAAAVIGGRRAVWAPMPAIAAVVVLDEHDEALQEERAPTWHAREVAIERARRAGAPCLLVSPCPTVTALAWTGTRWMRPTPGDEREGWPVVEVVDRGDEEPWRRSLVSSRLVAALRDHDRRVVCVHNTPGRARLLACRVCRSLLRCERCDAAVDQPDAEHLRCRRCGTERPPVCQACGSSALANVRPGVARLREELEAAAGRPVAAITADSDPGDVASADVHVGTEAVLHRVAATDVVVFLDLDTELFAPRYRAAEQAMALLVRAARLVGPRRGGGRIVVQTTAPRHEVVQAALLADPGRLARAEAAGRRALGLPPFAALARVGGEGADAFVASTGLEAAPAGDAWLVRAPTWEELGSALARTPRPRGSRVRVEVDPARG